MYSRAKIQKEITERWGYYACYLSSKHAYLAELHRWQTRGRLVDKSVIACQITLDVIDKSQQNIKSVKWIICKLSNTASRLKLKCDTSLHKSFKMFLYAIVNTCSLFLAYAWSNGVFYFAQSARGKYGIILRESCLFSTLPWEFREQ